MIMVTSNVHFFYLGPMKHAICHFLKYWAPNRYDIFSEMIAKIGMKNDYFKNQANVFSFNFYLIMISIQYEIKYNCNFQQIKFHK